MGDGPAYTVIGRGSTGLHDTWLTVRRRGGRLVRITVPLGLRSDAHEAELIELALNRLPELPGRHVY